ncbi:Os06g0177000 [Oryza sativa Japonica Group]|uniref:Os06g0177000 protein n=1 Tax=Oryza sativa subsp. japonica TaxID=39947 RepID=C7J3N7_ORYSJ|nr:Os06g0177000 [Oryza sativa Japonica Group]|eukprot:NP_001174630.1 Os06g0177000 [Oryza sativa Japonica Group]
MGKTPVRMKAVVYALSPFQQKVMPGLWKDITTKIHHKVSENWISATLLLAPIVGTYDNTVSLTLMTISFLDSITNNITWSILMAMQVRNVLQGAGEAIPQILNVKHAEIATTFGIFMI